MSITQIPFQDPVAPEKPQPEQLGLYDRQGWETAYRELDDDARIPHLLIQLQDDLAASRRREAAWISIIVHLLLIIFIVKFDFIEQHLPWMHALRVAVQHNPLDGKAVTFLPLPPDLQKAPKPKTNIASDKDRIASTRRPQLDPKELRKVLASPPPGPPGVNLPQPGQQAFQQSPPAYAQNPGQQTPPQRQPPPQTQQTAQLQMPRPNAADVFRKYGAPQSAGSQIAQATQATAAARGQQGQGGDFGLDQHAHHAQMGPLEILTDTMGVDFGPYLSRVLFDIKQNWYNLIPESAEMKKGKLAIEFAIMKDGSVQGLKVVAPSGDSALDVPAYASIKASNPFQPLPKEFGGQYLGLRIIFFYNPSKEDLE